MWSLYTDSKYCYSVDAMISYIHNHKIEVEKVPAKPFYGLLDNKSWIDSNNNHEYSPIDVINDPKKYPNDANRITEADLKYPIILSHVNDNYFVVDGYHRLAKAYLTKKKNIRVIIFNKDLLDKFILCKSKNKEKYLDQLRTFNIIDLYTKNFCR